MSIRQVEGLQRNKIPVQNVLISVFYKDGLEDMVKGLIDVNPDVLFMSTGGTYNGMKEMLGSDADKHLIAVDEYTEFPEMDGGLVKTLHPKIHAGLLGERNNPKHQEYIKNLSKTIKFLDDGVERVFDAELGKQYRVEVVEGVTGVYIDLMIGNLYPFEQVIKKIESGEINPKTKEPYNYEDARGFKDIGGPGMTRAAAKNFLSCAVICDPADYNIADTLVDGCTTFEQRFALQQKVWEMSWKYDKKISDFENQQDVAKVKALYEFEKEGE